MRWGAVCIRRPGPSARRLRRDVCDTHAPRTFVFVHFRIPAAGCVTGGGEDFCGGAVLRCDESRSPQRRGGKYGEGLKPGSQPVTPGSCASHSVHDATTPVAHCVAGECVVGSAADAGFELATCGLESYVRVHVFLCNTKVSSTISQVARTRRSPQKIRISC